MADQLGHAPNVRTADIRIGLVDLLLHPDGGARRLGGHGRGNAKLVAVQELLKMRAVAGDRD
jgi:hypothetical protein